MATQRIYKIVIGVIISLSALIYAFHGVRPQELIDELKNASASSLVVAGLLLLLGIYVRGFRWALVSGERRKHAALIYTKAIILGAFANQILPLRAGEFVRVFALKKLRPVSLAQVIVTSVLDRLVEVFMLILAAAIFISAGYYSHELTYAAYAIVLLCIVALLLVSAQFINKWLVRLFGIALARFGYDHINLVRLLNGVFSNFRSASPWVFMFSLLILLSDYLVATVVIRSIGIDVPFIAPLMLIVFFAFGSALPSAPAYVGIYQAAAVFVFNQFGVDSYKSLAVATIIQLVTIVTTLMASLWVISSTPKGMLTTVRSSVHVAER